MCARKDKQFFKTNQYVQTVQPGVRVGVDIMYQHGGQLIIVALNYFSRKAFARVLSSKEAFKVADFLSSVCAELPLQRMVTGNEREFVNRRTLLLRE